MRIPWLAVAGWYHATLLAALVWVVPWRPAWAPVIFAAAMIVYPLVCRSKAAEPWAVLAVMASSLAFLLIHGGWEVTAGWALLTGITALVVKIVRDSPSHRPDAGDLLAVGGWGVVFVLAPRLIEFSSGGWLAPALMLYAVQRLMREDAPGSSSPGLLASPTREVRGTLSLERVVLAGVDGLPASVPFDVEIRAGESMAVVCDDPIVAELLASLFAGRVRPRSGEIVVDGAPLKPGERVAAVVAPGEPFIRGDLDTNLGALCSRSLDRSDLAAVHEACSLGEVRDELSGRRLTEAGEPLTLFHRYLVLAARVIPSSYRLVVVVDQAPWVNAIRAELWRSVLARISTGRTSIWITADRELASRATTMIDYRNGAFRS